MFNISIGKRTFIVILCATMILFSMLYLVSDLMYTGGYKEIENQNVVQNVGRVTDALSAKLENLQMICYDWAVRDETYQFAASS